MVIMAISREITPDIEALPFELGPIHPGEILKEEFLEPYGITQRQLAAAINVPPNRISEIIRGRRGVTADTALRLAHYFGTSVEYWMGLQQHYDLDVARAGMQGVEISVFTTQTVTVAASPQAS